MHFRLDGANRNCDRGVERFPFAVKVTRLPTRVSSTFFAYILPNTIKITRRLVPKNAMGFTMQGFDFHLWMGMLRLLCEALGFHMWSVDLQLRMRIIPAFRPKVHFRRRAVCCTRPILAWEGSEEAAEQYDF